jgi:very-short-patch-repair endonuclease
MLKKFMKINTIIPNYTKTHNKITIICKEHGEFSQIAGDHLLGKGCPKCSIFYSGYNTKTWTEQAKIVHQDLYDYSKVEYTKRDTPVTIVCKIHGEFKQKPLHHIVGAGCPFCINKTEGKLYRWLKKIFPNIEREKKFDWCKSPITKNNFRFDFYIGDLRCIIELDGNQHFKIINGWKGTEYVQKKDVWKMQQANKNNVSIIRILQEDVFKNSDEWLDKNLLPLIKKYDKPSNYYIAEEKHGDIYKNHKELYKSEIKYEGILDEIIDIDIEDTKEEIKEEPQEKTKEKVVKKKLEPKLKTTPKTKTKNKSKI